MEPGIKLSVVWNDSDMIELLIVGFNGQFAGETRSYDNPDAMIEAASLLGGFPTSHSDIRELRIGQFTPNTINGGACLKFYCRDCAGHVTVDVEIQTDERDGPAEFVRFSLPVEPAAIDIFVKQLRDLQDDIYGRTASLAMAK